MSIIIIGENGYLGSYLNKNINIPDCCKAKNYIINCAGLVSVELAEEDYYRSYDSNVGVILKILKEYPNHKLINFSSYYVYDEPDKLCDETSNTTILYTYMKHKICGENLTLQSGGVCFRLGKLYGNHDINRQNRLVESIIKSNGDITLDCVAFNPTNLKTVLDVVTHEIIFGSMFGLFNLSDGGVTTHYDFGVHILGLLGVNKLPIKINKYHKLFHNYGNFAMDTSKIEKIINIKHWTESVYDYIKILKEKA